MILWVTSFCQITADLGRTLTYLISKNLSCRSNFVCVAATNGQEYNYANPNTYSNCYPKCNILPNITPKIEPCSCKTDIENTPPCKIEIKTNDKPDDIYFGCVSVLECEKTKTSDCILRVGDGPCVRVKCGNGEITPNCIHHDIVVATKTIDLKKSDWINLWILLWLLLTIERGVNELLNVIQIFFGIFLMLFKSGVEIIYGFCGFSVWLWKLLLALIYDGWSTLDLELRMIGYVVNQLMYVMY